jgi:UDP-N-acetylmuramate--alanine ligase
MFIDQVLKKKDTSRVFVCSDDENLMQVVQEFPQEKVITYGYDLRSDYAIKEVNTTSQATVFTIQAKSIQEPMVFTIQLFGEKNVSNATGMIAYLLHMGFAVDKIREAIGGFLGAKRRFEFIEKYEDIYLFDDYGHHPNEIIATIQAARARFPKSKIIVLFQPHTFSRTEHLKNEFIDALKQADISILLPIFASAREKGEDTISSGQIVEDAKKMGVTNITSVETLVDLEQVLYPHLKNNSIIFTMGAGDVYKLRSKIIPLMHQVNF